MMRGRLLWILAVAGAVTSGSCYGMCGQCVAEGSLVLTPTGEVSIEELRVGDMVTSFDPASGELYAGRIIATTSGLSWCRTYDTSLGGHIRVTADHPIYDPDARRYAPARRWQSQDAVSILALEDGSVNAARVTGFSLPLPCAVRNLSVASPDNNFFADGVLVHNKPPLRTGNCLYDDDCSVGGVCDNGVCVGCFAPCMADQECGRGGYCSREYPCPACVTYSDNAAYPCDSVGQADLVYAICALQQCGAPTSSPIWGENAALAECAGYLCQSCEPSWLDRTESTTPTVLRDCISFVSRLTCDDAPTFGPMFFDPNSGMRFVGAADAGACAALLVGPPWTQSVGQACGTGQPECLSGSYCAASATPGECGQCTADLPQGDDCTSAPTRCADGLYCDTSGALSSCELLRAAGTSCSSSSTCEKGLVCGDVGQCAAPASEGETCTRTEQCNHPLACTGGLCAYRRGVYEACQTNDACFVGGSCTAGQCVSVSHCADGPANAPCLDDRDCADGLFCSISFGPWIGTGSCIPYLAENDACASTCAAASCAYELCDPSLYCGAASTCIPKAKQTEDCTTHPCIDGLNCGQANICEQRRANGMACAADTECTSDYCAPSTSECVYPPACTPQ